MEEEAQEPASSDLYRPHVEVQVQVQPENPSFENLPEVGELRNVQQCESVPEMDDSQLVGAPAVVAGDADLAGKEDGCVTEMMVEMEVKVGEKSGVKRKRGRPPRVLARAMPKKKNDEEDVCFICFDGGNLVLCDRRGCPKAYHPACIKRDEAFFRSRAKWNCGWHICSNCEKASHYMCYTCTYSLCKGCIKEADILCVRGNKGFCTTCMRTVLLVENSGQGNKDMVQVDFDDKSSWEYLFKVYWIYLKTKLSLTVDELIKAKNPGKGAGFMPRKGKSSDELYDVKGPSSDISSADREGNTSKKKKTNKQPKLHNKEGSLTAEKSGAEKAISLHKGTEWASKELLKFVGHMKNGDTSVLSQFDVQALLLEYIKINNLRDPRRKSQIICDTRLGNMFGKARVGHFEMLKLIESHFLIREDSHADTIIQGGFIDAVTSQLEVNGNDDSQLMMGKDKRRKTRKKGDNKGPQTNLDEYAAIDVHNINLIYLRRSLMENLIEDTEKFHEKVVGSVVRIRISSNDQKQDMYRLVQVVGTSKVDVPSSKVGKKTADVMLEILNLDKKEALSIDGISNQEFSEDECRRLRQSIKCGLVKRFTVGEIKEKAVVLQAVRVNDWLETEILRLNHLRDRASEKGHRKELRECVEKLQLLNTPEERQRRLKDIPEVHADPNMDPNYESEEDAGESDNKTQDDYVGPRCSSFSKMGRVQGDISKDNESRARKNSPTTCERNSSMCTSFHLDKEEGATRAPGGENGTAGLQGRDAYGSNSCEKPRNLVDPTGSAIGAWNDQAVVGFESLSGVASETSTVPSTGMTPSSDNSETEKIWHYRDPAGRIQGPFCMAQLRKWNGYFPPDQRIWRINDQQDDSILLTDAFSGQYHKEPSLLYNSHDASAHSNGNNEFVRSSCSSNWSTPADVVNSKEGQAGSFPQGWDSLKDNNSLSDRPQMYSSLTSPTFSGKPYETVSHQEREGHRDERGCSGQNHGNWNSHGATVFPSNSGQSFEKCSNNRGYLGQSSTQSWRPQPVNCSSNGWNFNSGFVSVVKSSETSDPNHEVDFPNLPSPTPKPSNEDCKGQAAENKLSVSSNVPSQDSGPSRSTASSLVGGGAQLPEVAGEWGGYSPTPDKPSVEEWGSNPVSESSLKPTEVASDLAATPTSNGDQLTHSSPSHPASNTSNWQAIASGPNEFPLAEESVSDLLAEVDAMESLSGLPSPTSAMNCSEESAQASKNDCFSSVGGLSPTPDPGKSDAYCSEELAQASKNDCFSSVGGLSPTPDPGKSDALSSTSDVQMPSQSTKTDEPDGISEAGILDPQKSSGRHSSTSAEVEGEGKPSDVSVNQWEAGSDIQTPAPSTTSWDIPATDSARRAESETTDTGWGPVQENANLGLGGPAPINTNMGWGSDQGTAQGNANMNWGVSAGNLSTCVSQPKYSWESFSGPREGGFPGFGRDKPSWNSQLSIGGGGGVGGGSSRRPPKGQRICKFYATGHCRKGHLCDYLHR